MPRGRARSQLNRTSCEHTEAIQLDVNLVLTKSLFSNLVVIRFGTKIHLYLVTDVLPA